VFALAVLTLVLPQWTVLAIVLLRVGLALILAGQHVAHAVDVIGEDF
jgi:hypothetical protein